MTKHHPPLLSLSMVDWWFDPSWIPMIADRGAARERERQLFPTVQSPLRAH